MYGIFFCHMGSLLVLLRATAAKEGKKKKLLIGLQWLAYLCHVLCGLLYFKVFMGGGMYY